MILDIENNFNELTVSYFNKEGNIRLKKYKLTEEQCSNWRICSESDSKKSTEFRNWDGKPVKKVKDKRLQKFSIYEFINNLEDEDKDEIIGFHLPKIQSVDIETEVIDSFPDPTVARERITTIAISTETNKTIVLGWKQISKEQEKEIFDKHREYLKNFGDWDFKYICFEDEFNMMYTFVNKFIPNFSVMIGWNFMNFDWKYIYNRCKKLGIDITAASPSRKVQGNDNILMHVGIIDYLDIYRRWDRTVAIKESNSLDFVANAVLGTTKLKYNGTLQELYDNDYDKYVLYNAVDAALVSLIHRKLKTLNMVFSIGCICSIPIYRASSAVNVTEALLWKGYYKRNQVIADDRTDKVKGSYEGAYVKEPEPGMFKAATCFDYASLYPSIMRQYNVSPESFLRKELNQENLEKYRKDPNYVVSVTGAIYDNSKVSVLKEILTDLYTERKKNKNRGLDIDRTLLKITKKNA